MLSCLSSPRSWPLAVLWLPRVTTCSLLPGTYFYPPGPEIDLCLCFPTSHVPGVWQSLWRERTQLYLLEHILIQKHVWLLIDSICFIWVVCVLRNGTEFIGKGRMSGQVPGQWESSLRTKTGVCWYPFIPHSMLSPCMRSGVKLSASQFHLAEGQEPVIQQHVNKKSISSTGYFQLCVCVCFFKSLDL